MQCRQCNVDLNEHNTYKSVCYVSKKSGQAIVDKLCTDCRKKNTLLVYYLKKKVQPPIAGCEICGTITKLVCDHDHKTEQFRGWICSKCNRGLGFFGDSANLVSKALDYLNDRSRDSADLAGQ